MDRLDLFEEFIKIEKEKEDALYRENEKQRHAYKSESLNSILIKIKEFKGEI